MSSFRVLISCPVIHDRIDEYAPLFEAHGVKHDVPDVDQQLTEDELLDVISKYDGVLAGDDQFTRRVFSQAENLKVISKWGIGTDNIDRSAAEEFGVTVRRTPGTLSTEVADVVMGYAVMLARDLHTIDRAARDGDWWKPRGISLAGKTFGIVGVGDIGSAVARRASAFDMNLLGNDVRPIPDDLGRDTGIEAVDRDELMERADFVSLNCALTEQTEGMIDQAALERLGGEGYLINTARGELVDQDALVDALRYRTIAGAALDVFVEEPLSEVDPLTDIDNVILGTHNAQNTHEAVARVNDRAVENLLTELEAHEA